MSSVACGLTGEIEMDSTRGSPGNLEMGHLIWFTSCEYRVLNTSCNAFRFRHFFARGQLFLKKNEFMCMYSLCLIAFTSITITHVSICLTWNQLILLPRGDDTGKCMIYNSFRVDLVDVHMLQQVLCCHYNRFFEVIAAGR